MLIEAFDLKFCKWMNKVHDSPHYSVFVATGNINALVVSKSQKAFFWWEPMKHGGLRIRPQKATAWRQFLIRLYTWQ